MIRSKKSCFNVSHFDRNRWTACLSTEPVCVITFTFLFTLLFLCGDDDTAKACFSTFAVAD